MPEPVAEPKAPAAPERAVPERHARRAMISPGSVVVFAAVLAVYTVILYWVLTKSETRKAGESAPGSSAEGQEESSSSGTGHMRGRGPVIEVAGLTQSIPEMTGGTTTKLFRCNVAVQMDLDARDPFEKPEDAKKAYEALDKLLTPSLRENITVMIKDYIITEVLSNKTTVYELREQNKKDWKRKIKDKANEILEKNFGFNKEYQGQKDNKYKTRPVVWEVSFTLWDLTRQ